MFLIRYWKGTKACKTGVYFSPCQLDEKVKSCTFLRTLLQANYYGVKVELKSHLRALRAALTVFAQEHTVSTGVEVEGPFKCGQYAGSGSTMYNSLSHDREDHVSVTKCRGEERALRLSCFMVVQKVPRDAHLHLERTPPSCSLDALLYGRHRGLSRWRLAPLPSLRDCAASDQGPSHLTSTYGVVAARRPPMKRTTNHARTATSVALVTQRTCQPGTLRIVRMALLTEPVPRKCTAGVTPAPSENLGQDD